MEKAESPSLNVQDGPPGPLLGATSGGRMAAAHKALAKKRALAALQRLAEEKIALQEKAEKYGHNLDEVEIPPIPEKEEIVDTEKKEHLTEAQEAPTDQEPKMSSSEDIEMKPIAEDESIQQTNQESPRKKKKEKKRKRNIKLRSASSSSSNSASEEDEPPKKRLKKGNLVTTPRIIPPKDIPISPISNAIHTIRNISVPPVLSNAVRDSAASVGWGIAVLAMVLLRGFVSSRVRSYALKDPQLSWAVDGGGSYPPPIQKQTNPPPIPQNYYNNPRNIEAYRGGGGGTANSLYR